MNIREIRTNTGLTQKEFADKLGIPLGTIRRWEYGESKPAPYIVNMIVRQFPINVESMIKIVSSNGRKFYYNVDGLYVVDECGTKIFVSKEIQGVNESNLAIYLCELFDSYYEILNKFENDCIFDKKEGIIWS